MLGYKTSFNIFKNTDVRQSIFSYHNEMMLQITKRRSTGKLTNIWKLNSRQTIGQRRNHRKIRKQKQITVKAQYTKTYGIQRKQCSEGNLHQSMPTLKNIKDLKSTTYSSILRSQKKKSDLKPKLAGERK